MVGAKYGDSAVPDRETKKLLAQLFSAHEIGGRGMGEYPGMAVVDSAGKHHRLSSPWILDGSIFPTSVGANHSLPIYAMVASQASLLANTIGAKNKSKI